MNDDAEPAPADSPREPAAADAPSAPATRDPDAENAAAVADAVRAAAALDAAEAEAPAALPRAQLAHVPPPERVPIRYLVSMVAAVWIGAALLYLISKLGLPTTRSRIAMVCTVMLDLFPLLRSRAFRTWLWDVTFGQWPKIDAETVRTPAEAGTFSWRVLGIMVLVAVSLTLQEYIGDRSYFEHLFPVTPWQHYKLGALAWPGSWGVQSPMRYYHELAGFAWWSGWRVLGYIVMPVMFILAWPGYRLRDVHIRFDGFFRHLWIYVFLFALVLPAVLYASTTPAFRHTYPFYRLANRSRFDLWTWEGLYSAQFVALEFFFRGFILQGLRKVMGANAVFVMIVPYCMIHYGKPLPETLGAIGAGLILGTLALRTRSIWGGVLIHIGVALTMDVLALQGCPKSPGGWCSE